MSDLISRQAAIDAILAVTGNSSVRELYEHVQEHGLSEMWSGGVSAAIDIIIAVPSAQPEPSEITDEQAILHLQSTGWMQNHDREMYESGLRERLADDTGSYDSLVPCDDAISRQVAIDALMKRDKELRNINWYDKPFAEGECKGIDDALEIINTLPSTQPTLCGYDIKHLMLIAEVLRKENLPPERVADALMDIGRIVSIVSDEFEESLREAMKQCKI